MAKAEATTGRKVRAAHNELTVEQERFARYVASGLSAYEAYRRAYNKEHVGSRWSNSARVRALPQVMALIEALQEEARVASRVDREGKLRILAERILDPDESARERLAAIKLHNEMTGDNAPVRVEMFGVADLFQLVQK